MSKPIERITQAAIQVFREQGVNAARMEDIARAAKLSRPNLYRYVADREDLIRLVILQRASIIRHELKVLPGDWHEALIDLFVRVVRLSFEDEIFMLMIREAGSAVAQLFSADDDAIRTTLNKVVMPLLARGRAAGQIREDLGDEEIMLWLHYQTWSLVRDPKIQKALDVKKLARKFVIAAFVTVPPRPQNAQASRGPVDAVDAVRAKTPESDGQRKAGTRTRKAPAGQDVSRRVTLAAQAT